MTGLVYVGTSGFSYKDWKPRFYPKDVSGKKLLAHYATRLRTVEINNTFYKRPTKAQLEAWAADVPDHFRFVFKASRYFSAGAGIRDARALGDFFALLGAVNVKLGPLLVVFPPHIKKDLALLEGFVAAIPVKQRVALELQDPSWRDDAVMDAMRARDVAWCVTESDDAPLLGRPTLTASWGYFRLRRARYTPRALAVWAETLRDANVGDAFVIFRHDDDGTNAVNATKLVALLNPSPTPRSAERPHPR